MPAKVLLVDAIDCLIVQDKNKNLSLNQEFFDYLQTRSERKIVVTNAKSETLTKIKNLLPKSEIFTLEFNPDKSRPEYFTKLLQKFNLEAENCFYFDHEQTSLNSAKLAGIEGVLYENNEQIIQVLEDSFKTSNLRNHKAYIVEKSLPAEKFAELFKFGSVILDKASKDWGKLVYVYFEPENEQSLLEFLSQNLLTKSEDKTTSWYCEVGTKVVFAGKIIDVATDQGFTDFQKYGRSLGIPTEQLDALSARSFGN